MNRTAAHNSACCFLGDDAITSSIVAMWLCVYACSLCFLALFKVPEAVRRAMCSPVVHVEQQNGPALPDLANIAVHPFGHLSHCSHSRHNISHKRTKDHKPHRGGDHPAVGGSLQVLSGQDLPAAPAGERRDAGHVHWRAGPAAPALRFQRSGSTGFNGKGALLLSRVLYRRSPF